MKPQTSKLLLFSSILSLPGFFSVILSIISIPIHLKFAGPESYGNYIMFQFIIVISIILNFGIGKSIVVSISNYPSKSKEINYEGIKYTLIVLLIVISILSILLYLVNSYCQIKIIQKSLSIHILGGIGITVLYTSLESILQGNQKFKTLSFFNFMFYSLGLSFPSILLFFYENLQLEEIVLLSIVVKLLTIFLMAFVIFKKKLIFKSKSKILLKNLKKNAKWLTLNNILIYYYDLLDKYLIKIFLGPIALTIYTIPQQLTGKLSIISKGFSAYLLTKLSEKKNNNEVLNFSLKIFLKTIPIFIFILFNIYEQILSLWLGNQYNQNILLLTKVFSICAIFSCASHLLITKFEASKSLKQNSKIEFCFTPLFFIGLYFLTSNEYTLLKISILILLKEVILLFLRLYLLRKIIKNLNLFYLYIFLILILLFVSINFQNFLLITLISLIIVKHIVND